MTANTADEIVEQYKNLIESGETSPEIHVDVDGQCIEGVSLPCVVLDGVGSHARFADVDFRGADLSHLIGDYEFVRCQLAGALVASTAKLKDCEIEDLFASPGRQRKGKGAQIVRKAK